jgi:hypothetical protein
MVKNKKLIIALLAFVLALSVLCGCGYNPKTVVTIEDYEVPAGIYLTTQLAAYNEVANENEADPATLDFLDTEVDGVSARELVNQKTIDLLVESVLVDKEFERLGIEFTEMDEYYVNYYVNQIWNTYAAHFEKNGIGYDSYLDSQRRNYKYSLLVDKLYGEGGEQAFSEEEVRAFYEEHYTKVDYIELPTTDSGGAALSAETLEAVSLVATEMMKDAEASNSLQHAYLNYFGEVNAIMGSDTAVDEAAFQTALHADTVVSDLNQNFYTEFTEMALGLESGKYGVFNNGAVIYLFKVNGVAADEDYSDNLTTMIASMASDPFDEYIKEKTTDYVINVDQRARDYYSLDKMYPSYQ